MQNYPKGISVRCACGFTGHRSRQDSEIGPFGGCPKCQGKLVRRADRVEWRNAKALADLDRFKGGA